MQVLVVRYGNETSLAAVVNSLFSQSSFACVSGFPILRTLCVRQI